MRRWIVYVAAFGVMAAFRVTGFAGTDVGKLQPVQAVRVGRQEHQLILETDTGDAGTGTDPASALADLQACAAGKLFLETADYLVVQPGCEKWIRELTRILRPSCKICMESGNVDPEAAAGYLAVHEPSMTLRDWMAGERKIPVLKEREGRLELVP